jgi:hypothetical protein
MTYLDDLIIIQVGYQSFNTIFFLKDTKVFLI